MYTKPKKPFEKGRIDEENVLLKKYGLKNKKEIWKTNAKVNYFRKRAMVLARETPEAQEVLFGKLRGIGLNIKTTADVLGLKVEDLLERRLPTVLYKKKLANTPKHARQLVAHKKVLIGNQVVSSPGYIVPINEEKLLSIKEKKKAPKQPEPSPEETKEETPTQEETKEEEKTE